MTQIPLFNSPFLLGFDQLERALDRVSKSSADGYPPYNIEQDGENALRITLAVADLGRELQVDIRGKQFPATVVDLPFYKAGTARKLKH